MRIRGSQDLGALARQRRRDLGISQKDLAARADVTRQWLVRFEQGNTDVTLSKAFAVLTELGLTVRVDTGTTSAQTAVYEIPKVDVGRFAVSEQERTLTSARLDELRDRIRQLHDD